MTDLDDIHYIDKITDGDVNAFVHIMRRHERMIFTIVNKILANEQDSEDVVQEIFIKAYQSLHKFRRDSQFSTWLYRIAYNTTISHVRKSRKDQEMNSDALQDLPDDEVDESHNSVQKEELLSYLDEALQKLKPEDALMITMFYMNNHSMQEIGEITGHSVINVKVKLHRIRKFMNFEINKSIRHGK